MCLTNWYATIPKPLFNNKPANTCKVLLQMDELLLNISLIHGLSIGDCLAFISLQGGHELPIAHDW